MAKNNRTARLPGLQTRTDRLLRLLELLGLLNWQHWQDIRDWQDLSKVLLSLLCLRKVEQHIIVSLSPSADFLMLKELYMKA